MSFDVSLQMDVDTGGEKPYQLVLFDGNVTFNLAPMWHKAGWDFHLVRDRPASEVIHSAESVLFELLLHPEEYTPLNPANGWGSYDTLVNFFTEFVQALKRHPKSIVRIY